MAKDIRQPIQFSRVMLLTQSARSALGHKRHVRFTPQKRNFADAVEMSAKGQNRTKASALISAACCGVSGAFIQI